MRSSPASTRPARSRASTATRPPPSPSGRSWPGSPTPWSPRRAAPAVWSTARSCALSRTRATPRTSASHSRSPGPWRSPQRRPAAPSLASRWREIVVGANTVTRPPGVGLDSGGLAKGLFADLLGADLGGHRSFAVDCSGDLLLGGDLVREVHVDDPFGRGGPLHTFRLAAGGVATSGIARRSWRDADGRPAHHLLDPSTGCPAYTGIVQATALAPTALEAEIRAKAALLSGPSAADAWLPDGGVIVFDDGRHRVLEPTTERIDDGTPRPAAAA
jgi:thiamine biosynthesis lipoprotein